MMKILIQGKYVLVFLAFFIVNCTPSVERYKNKARKALQKEDSVRALEYLQKAFEVSLDSDFFPVGSWHSYTNIYSPTARNKIVLVENQPSKTKSYLTIYDIVKDKSWRRRIKGYIRNVSLSPNGRYAGIQLSDAKSLCTLTLWDLSAKDQLAFSNEAQCGETAGISDDGRVVFTGKNKAVQMYTISSGKLDDKYIAEIPAAPTKNVPGLATFQFTAGNRLFMVYGSLGLYYLYAVENREFRLISRDGAASKLYFVPGSENPGLITGGANNHQVTFFDAASAGISKTYPVRYWKDAVFLKENEYYYVEDDRLVEVRGGVEKKLPFWAVKTYADISGTVYFLSPRGQMIAYKGKEPAEQSAAIFQLGWEIR